MCKLHASCGAYCVGLDQLTLNVSLSFSLPIIRALACWSTHTLIYTHTHTHAAPCQYAHKLAFLIGQNVHRDPHPDLAHNLFYLWSSEIASSLQTVLPFLVACTQLYNPLHRSVGNNVWFNPLGITAQSQHDSSAVYLALFFLDKQKIPLLRRWTLCRLWTLAFSAFFIAFYIITHMGVRENFVLVHTNLKIVRQMSVQRYS